MNTNENPYWNDDPDFVKPTADWMEMRDSHDVEQKRIFSKDWDNPTPIFQLVEVANNNKPYADIICRIGNWVVSTKGDIAYLYRDDNMIESSEGYMGTEDTYDIDNERLDEEDWIIHLTEKVWFTEQCFEDFKRAYFVACKIAGVKPVKQVKRYAVW